MLRRPGILEHRLCLGARSATCLPGAETQGEERNKQAAGDSGENLAKFYQVVILLLEKHACFI